NAADRVAAANLVGEQLDQSRRASRAVGRAGNIDAQAGATYSTAGDADQLVVGQVRIERGARRIDLEETGVIADDPVVVQRCIQGALQGTDADVADERAACCAADVEVAQFVVRHAGAVVSRVDTARDEAQTADADGQVAGRGGTVDLHETLGIETRGIAVGCRQREAAA